MNCFGPTDADCSSCYHPFKLEYTSCLEDCNDGEGVIVFLLELTGFFKKILVSI